MRVENYGHTLRTEFRTLDFWRDVFAEFVGTFFLLATQCSVPLLWGDPSKFGTVIVVALGMGFTVTGLAEVIGPFSGCHINPAVTLAMAISVKITFVRALLYTAVQCAGAIAGAAFIWGMTPAGRRDSLAATTLGSGIEPWQGMLIETWITAFLCLVVFGATNAKRKAVYMPSIVIGFAVAAGIMNGFAYTGGSMNPARSLGPAVLMNIWKDHWVYWVGPLLGGAVAGAIYWILFNLIDRRRNREVTGKDEYPLQ